MRRFALPDPIDATEGKRIPFYLLIIIMAFTLSNLTIVIDNTIDKTVVLIYSAAPKTG